MRRLGFTVLFSVMLPIMNRFLDEIAREKKSLAQVSQAA